MRKAGTLAVSLMLVLLLVSPSAMAQEEMSELEMAGRAFQYSVGDYTLQVTFEDEDVIHWEYLEAPTEEEVGTNETDEITRFDVRDDVILMSWQESSGTYVIDVLDLGAMKLYYNFVTADQAYGSGVADITEVTEGVEPAEAMVDMDEVESPELAGTVLSYSVGEYQIEVGFEEEDVVHWEYVGAPTEEEVGTNETDEVTRADLRSDLILMTWQENSGTYVIDVVDLANNKLYANFVTADHAFGSAQPDITVMAAGEMMAEEEMEEMEQPNIIWLVIDDAGYSDFGFFGSEIPTPNLDTLADNGVRFTDFHTAPSCSPTRSELLTGQDHHSAGFGNMAEDVTDAQRGQPGYEGFLNERTLPIGRLMQENGYHTYMVGKWHLGVGENIPFNSGFEETFTLINGFSGHYGPQPGFAFEGEPIVQTFTRNGEPVEWPEGEYSSDVYTDRIIEFIESDIESDQPFFAYVAYTAPHDPVQAPEEWIEMFEGQYDDGYEPIHQARVEAMQEMGILPYDTTVSPFPEEEVTAWEDLSDEERAAQIRGMETYAAMVAKLDDSIGRLLEYLEETGELDNTWIFAFSDNGPNGEGQNAYFSEDFLEETYDNSPESIGTPDSFYLVGGGWAWVSSAPFRLAKGTPAEGGVRTPMIVYGPDVVKAGEISHSYAEVTDLYPSTLDLAGIEFPESYNDVELLPLIGQSVVPYVNDEADTIHDDQAVFGWELWGRAALRKGDWKILWLREPQGVGDWQLYNLAIDPAESVDLAELFPDKLDEMVAEWDNYVEENGLILVNGQLGVLPWEAE